MLRRLLFWVLVLLVVLFIGGYLLLFPPLPIPPEIGAGLPSNFAEADKEFGQRVSAAFPLSIMENEFTARLIGVEGSLGSLRWVACSAGSASA